MTDGSRLGDLIGVGRTAEVFAWGDDRVIKILRPGVPDREAELEAAAAERATAAGLAAPRFIGMERMDGRIGLIYERVSGPAMVDELARRPWRTTGFAVQLAELHAQMHEQAGPALPSALASLRYAIEEAAPRLGEPARSAALRRIDELPDGSAIVHGDLHPGNVLITEHGPLVIDWLTAAHGPPAADVARTLFLITETPLPASFRGLRRVAIELIRRRFARAYVERYRALRPADAAAAPSWRLPILAARMAEGVDGEERLLPALIERETAVSRPE